MARKTTVKRHLHAKMEISIMSTDTKLLAAQARIKVLREALEGMLEIEAEVSSLKEYNKIVRKAQQSISTPDDTAELDALIADAKRLDYLDRNAKFKMGWRVGQAPAGNLSVNSVIQLGAPTTSIRAAIDATMKEAAP